TLSCPYCKTAAKDLQKMKTENPTLPVYFIIPYGEDSTIERRLNTFLEETKVTDIPMSFVPNEWFRELINESGNNSIPVILWIENGIIIRQVSISELNLKETEIWIGK